MRVAPRGFLPALLLLAALGCGSETTTELDNYLEALEFGKPMQRMVEVDAGRFRIPVTGELQQKETGERERAWMQLRFGLFVVAAPRDRASVEDLMEEHRGVFRDTVYRICRSTSLDELSDPRFTTMKAKLTDAIRQVLGEERVKQVLLVDVTSESL